MAEHESSLAVLVDFENMARPGAKGRGDFDINLVLDRLAEKGRVLVKRAYADWSRYRDARHELMNSGLELIEMPSAREGAKNRADIKMAVDAMELAYSREHLDTFVIVSGDSDFTPLVGKLRELNKRVTGMGNRDSTSDLLIANCDEFIYYDSLAASRGGGTATGRKLDPLDLLRQTLTALQREGTEWPLASVVKDSMRRKNPAFDENDTGYSTFSKFLEHAQSREIVRLQTDPRSGTYRVELGAVAGAAAAAPAAPPAAPDTARATSDDERDAGRRRRRRRRGDSGEPKAEVFEIVIDNVADAAIADIPLDQPISYEDVILAGPDPVADTPALLEASDVAGAAPEPSADTAPAPARRRRRAAADRSAGTALSDETPAYAPPSAGEAAPAEDAEDTDASPGRSRRRRRRSPAAAEAPPVEPDASGAPVPTEVAPTTSAPTAPEPVAAQATADDADAPRGRGRVPRRRAGASATPAEAPAAEEAPAEDKPKRRTRRTKAQVEADKAATPTEAPAAEEAPAEDKPKRRTRRTKAQIEADKAATPTEAPAAEETPAEDKPKRRTRRTKAQIEADKAATPTEAPAAEETPAEDKPKRRTRRTKAQIEADKAAAEAGEKG